MKSSSFGGSERFTPRAFSTASAPRLSAAGGGGDQIWVQFVSARPQYAIAHWESACAISVKALAASRYQKECSSATARSKDACTAGEQETGNFPPPIFSVWAPAVETESATIASTSQALGFIAWNRPFRRAWRTPPPRRHGRVRGRRRDRSAPPA